jgi:pimeloyl-ACP methyl ester carboxylesterase
MGDPTIIFVPGLWEGGAVFIPTARKLQIQGFSTVITTLPSLGHASPGNPSLVDDIAAIRAFIEPVVSRERDVVLVCHSVGGYALYSS